MKNFKSNKLLTALVATAAFAFLPTIAIAADSGAATGNTTMSGGTNGASSSGAATSANGVNGANNSGNMNRANSTSTMDKNRSRSQNANIGKGTTN